MKKEKSEELLFFVPRIGLDRRASRGEAGIPLKVKILLSPQPTALTLSGRKRRVPQVSDFFIVEGVYSHNTIKKRRITTIVVTRL